MASMLTDGRCQRFDFHLFPTTSQTSWIDWVFVQKMSWSAVFVMRLLLNNLKHIFMATWHLARPPAWLSWLPCRVYYLVSKMNDNILIMDRTSHWYLMNENLNDEMFLLLLRHIYENKIVGVYQLDRHWYHLAVSIEKALLANYCTVFQCIIEAEKKPRSVSNFRKIIKKIVKSYA